MHFYGTEKLEEVILPNTISTIGDNAFATCQSLEEIDIPKTVENVGTKIFTAGSLNVEITVNVAWKEGEKPEGWAEDWNVADTGTVTVNYAQ